VHGRLRREGERFFRRVDHTAGGARAGPRDLDKATAAELSRRRSGPLASCGSRLVASTRLALSGAELQKTRQRLGRFKKGEAHLKSGQEPDLFWV